MNRQGVSSGHNITYESMSNDTDSASLVYHLKQSEKTWKKIRDHLNVRDIGKMAVENPDKWFL